MGFRGVRLLSLSVCLWGFLYENSEARGVFKKMPGYWAAIKAQRAAAIAARHSFFSTSGILEAHGLGVLRKTKVLGGWFGKDRLMNRVAGHASNLFNENLPTLVDSYLGLVTRADRRYFKEYGTSKWVGDFDFRQTREYQEIYQKHLIDRLRMRNYNVVNWLKRIPDPDLQKEFVAEGTIGFDFVLRQSSGHPATFHPTMAYVWADAFHRTRFTDDFVGEIYTKMTNKNFRNLRAPSDWKPRDIPQRGDYLDLIYFRTVEGVDGCGYIFSRIYDPF